jgi:NTP pyrophosphatase (non-canonical NTP hydrolase)
MENFNNLTPAQIERIALLMEECGEVIQACGKILRHGLDSYSPLDPDQTTNREMLEKELGDVRYAEGLLIDSGDVSAQGIKVAERRKEKNCPRYLHHQPAPSLPVTESE